jgi:hypothetical protein
MADREARPPLDLNTITRLMEAGVSIFVPTRQGLIVAACKYPTRGLQTAVFLSQR